jgi:membrane associated rhomboid family serine protease
MAYCYRHPDRETGLSCSECERPICTDCATFASVGIRCPDHAGVAQGVKRVATGARRASVTGTGALVTKTLIGLNVLVFLAMLSQGASLGEAGGDLFARGALLIQGQLASGELVGLAEGEWWRLLTAAFLHAGIIHLGFNMLMLWWIGAPLEEAMGRARFLLLYAVSGLAGSAGALMLSPDAVTVGASGAVFGLLGAAFVLERQAGITAGPVLTIIILNLAITFLVPRISIGGHLGGLAGGALAMLAFSRFGRGHALYGRLGAVGLAGVVAVGIASVAVAYFQVERYI